ncbi:MAG: Na(+)/H(+) antiporter subunit B [Alphaproteobacteria bacterium]
MIFHLDKNRPMADNWIGATVIRMVIPMIMLFALYVQFHGDYSPGGGFQAGVLLAVGLIMYAMLVGISKARRVIPMSYLRFLLALGVLVYGGVGVANMLMGKNFLDYSSFGEGHKALEYGVIIIEFGVGITVFASMSIICFVLAGRENVYD